MSQLGGKSENIILFPTTYGNAVPKDKIDSNTEVYILDFSYPLEDMIWIGENCKDILWIDHHKTAVPVAEALKEIEKFYGRVYFDLSKSGAMLTWEFWHPDEEPFQMISYIQDRDLWKFELQGTKEFHLNLGTYPRDIAMWNNICERIENNPMRMYTFIQEGEAVQRYYDSQVVSIIANGTHPITIDGVTGLVCNAPYAYASDIGHKLATMCGTFGAVWSENKEGATVFSLRSNGEFDVSLIAQNFGGGGHKNAAGFVLVGAHFFLEGSTLWSSGYGPKQ
jgi:oligoribonuclease NrnB/cAMP/cGMP phosphodiesterase (DHH superfamily)